MHWCLYIRGYITEIRSSHLFCQVNNTFKYVYSMFQSKNKLYNLKYTNNFIDAYYLFLYFLSHSLLKIQYYADVVNVKKLKNQSAETGHQN